MHSVSWPLPAAEESLTFERAIKRQLISLLSSQCAFNKGGKVKGFCVQVKGTQKQPSILSSPGSLMWLGEKLTVAVGRGASFHASPPAPSGWGRGGGLGRLGESFRARSPRLVAMLALEDLEIAPTV